MRIYTPSHKYLGVQVPQHEYVRLQLDCHWLGDRIRHFLLHWRPDSSERNARRTGSVLGAEHNYSAGLGDKRDLAVFSVRHACSSTSLHHVLRTRHNAALLHRSRDVDGGSDWSNSFHASARDPISHRDLWTA